MREFKKPVDGAFFKMNDDVKARRMTKRGRHEICMATVPSLLFWAVKLASKRGGKEACSGVEGGPQRLGRWCEQMQGPL